MEPLLLIGSSGHAGVILDILSLQSRYRVVGLLDSFAPEGSKKHGYEIVGVPEDVASVGKRYGCSAFFVAIGDNWGRHQLSAQLLMQVPSAELISVAHPSAVISKSARLGRGSSIMAGAVVGNSSSVGPGCIVNTGSSIDHDSELNEFSSVGPGVHLGGGVVVGERSAIGIGAAVIHNVRIGNDTVIGAGSAVVRNMPDRVVAYGVPAAVIRSREMHERYL